MIFDAFHPSEFILEEMGARGWTVQDLCIHGDCDTAADRMAWELYLTVGEDFPEMFIGPTGCAQLSRAFGTSVKMWANLNTAWLQRERRGEN